MPTVDDIKGKLSAAVGEVREAVGQKTGEDTSNDGLRQLKARIGRLTKLRGRELEIRVGAAGGVFAGDPVILCREFAPGEPVRFANGGNAKVLDTANAPHAGVNVICYTQDGQTKLKAFWLTTDAGEPSLRLSNTVTLLEDEALPSGAVCLSQDGKTCYVVYQRDGDGMIQVVDVAPATGVCQVKATDIWMDGGNPENIVAACVTDKLAICCTQMPEDKTQDADRKAVLLTLHTAVDSAGAVALVIDAEEVLTQSATPALHGMTYSKDGFAHGWAMAAYADTLYITYPKPGGKGRGVLVAVLQDGGYVPSGYTDCFIQGSVPSAHLAEQMTQDTYGLAGAVTLAHGVARLNQAGQIESLLALEMWVRQAGDSRPLPLWIGEENVVYGQSLTMACSGHMGAAGGFAGYGMEDHGGGVYRMLGIALELRPDGAVGGPSVELGTFSGYATILPGDATHAAYVYDLLGSAYIRPIRQRRVAVRATAGMADATAQEDGQSGDRIRVIRHIPPADT